jgi:hypothetical protein
MDAHAKPTREERLAAALRENLLKRKALARAQGATEISPPSPAAPPRPQR